MGAIMRAHDWTSSPLGDPAGWPDTLKMMLATCLSSKFPMVIWWGPQLIMLYNDACQPILGETKHPHGMGRPKADSWPETWPIVGEQFERALKGEASWSEDLLLASDRNGYIEECYFTYSHSPLRDASGLIVGVLSVVRETTLRVLSQRRRRTLGRLSEATIEAATQSKTLEETCRTLTRLLSFQNPDIPFAALYLIQSGHAKLGGCSGAVQSLFPSTVAIGDADPWGIGAAATSAAPHEILSLERPVESGAWPEPVTQAVSLPLKKADKDQGSVGVLVLGVNSRCRLDDAYLEFMHLTSTQFAGTISALQSLEREKREAKTNELLIRELEHRTRNLLAVIHAVSRRTITSSSNLEEYGREFHGRLTALSRVQDLLSREASDQITVGELLKLEIDAVAATECHRIAFDGPPVPLPRAAVQLLALAIHELLTNAVKHGALNGSGGRVELVWSVANSETIPVLRLNWIETGWQKAASYPVSRKGFGRHLLEQALPAQLDARTEFDISSSGITCTIELPLVTPR